MGKTVRDLIMEYFKKHPLSNFPHRPVVDWVEEQYIKLYGRKPRDIWRSIRRLYQEGILIKVKKGVYKYDPAYVKKKKLLDFSQEVKEEALKRDNYKCVWCGRGKKDGVEICVDHITPLDLGGTNTLDNAQTLCMQCNLIKKNYSQSAAGKRFVIRMYEQAVVKNDKRMIEFCKQIFDVYNKFQINSHIKRPDKE
ncbi:MAG: HNH endonuclease [Candidatus Omnitrophica bacterium]|nr:HNH endonuclease [Candidatus Omnitrophota bacterium]